MEIEILKTSAEFEIFRVGSDIRRSIDHYNVEFIINFDNSKILKDIEPITIKIKEIPDSTKELETLIFKEFAKIFQPRVIR